MIGYLVLIGIGLIVLERVIPDQKLPQVKGWWSRVVLINIFQMGILILGGFTWDRWFQGASLFRLKDHLPVPFQAIVAYFVITFVYYWWHRARHDVPFLWNTMHQLHHSPRRIETITSFYKHPVEIIINSLIIGSIIYLILGSSVAAGALTSFLTGIAEYFYHMNIKTPRWVGYFLQRPEMHRIHHKRSHHYGNFADLPLWDMLFGTYDNPPTYQGDCGFKPEREEKLLDMLVFKNVNDPIRPR